MEYLIEEIVDADTLRKARREYEDSERWDISNERSQSQYGSCLIRCRSDVDITRGISLLKDLLERTNDPQIERDCLFYLTIGYTKQKKYFDAFACTERLLRMEAYNRQFQEWKEYFKGLGIAMLIKGGKVLGSAALLAGGIYGLVKLGQYLTSNEEEAPVQYRPAIKDDMSSAKEKQEWRVAGQMNDLHIGNEFNQWKRCDASYGRCDSAWLKRLDESHYVGDMDIGSRQWDRACNAVDEVKTRIQSEIRVRAESEYRELKIDSYILQGSARDGLKVIAPDEFDVGFEFHIEGIHLEECSIFRKKSRKDRKIPGFCYLKVTDTASKVEKKCPKLWKKGVFIHEGGDLYLSSKKLHNSIFQSLIDQSTRKVEKQIMQDGGFDFKIKRKSNPPAVNITIAFDQKANDYFMREGKRQPAEFTNEIDVDLIPALRLNTDRESVCFGRRVNAPIHAICKWKEEESAKALEIADQRLVWLVNSVAYERFVFDVAQRDSKQQYILTALRITKTYMTKVKSGKVPPPQIATVLHSYHLKQITCYLILYTCYVYPEIHIDGAQRALVFLIGLLDKCLDTGRLPHFFYSNSQIGQMFQNYPDEVHDDPPFRFDMLRKVSKEAKRQALLSLRNDLKHDLGINGQDSGDDLSRVTEWAVPVFMDVTKSEETIGRLLADPPLFITVCCVGEKIGKIEGRVRAIVVLAHPAICVYHLFDGNQDLVKEGKLASLLLDRNITKVFLNIGSVSRALIQEYDILMNAAPIRDIQMMFEKVQLANMDLEKIKDKWGFAPGSFKKWQQDNETCGLKLGDVITDQDCLSQVIAQGKCITVLYKLCNEKITGEVLKKLKAETYKAAIPFDEKDELFEKVKKLKIKNSSKKPKTANTDNQQQPQQAGKKQPDWKKQSGGNKGGKKKTNKR